MTNVTKIFFRYRELLRFVCNVVIAENPDFDHDFLDLDRVLFRSTFHSVITARDERTTTRNQVTVFDYLSVRPQRSSILLQAIDEGLVRWLPIDVGIDELELRFSALFDFDWTRSPRELEYIRCYVAASSSPAVPTGGVVLVPAPNAEILFDEPTLEELAMAARG